jgi:hypothetical protein
MKFAATSMFAGAAIALLLATSAAAGTIQVVTVDDEYASFHPKPVARAATPVSGEDFRSVMDRVFGPGRWRMTSSYRSQAQEDALRRQGAGTVAPGHISLHSVGGPNAPEAYDAVVDHMPLATAAAKLRQAGGGFSRVLAEGAHGPQGAHLHVELVSARMRTAQPQAFAEGQTDPDVARGRRGRAARRSSSAGAAES